VVAQILAYGLLQQLAKCKDIAEIVEEVERWHILREKLITAARIQGVSG
jgi:hypothetical protein